MIRAPILPLAFLVAMTAASAAEPAQDIVSASTLKRTYTTTPTWPASANGTEGWVLLHFTLQPDGTVSDVEVKEAHPAGIFDESAVQTLRQWKYEPVEREGKKVAQRVEIRVKYALPR